MKSVAAQCEVAFNRLVFPADSTPYLRLLGSMMFEAGRRSVKAEQRRQRVATLSRQRKSRKEPAP